MKNLPRNLRTDPLALAGPMAAALGVLVVTMSALVWGRTGFFAAAFGAGLSGVNWFVLRRLSERAAFRAVVEGPATATAGLLAALTAKSMAMLLIVSVVVRLVGAQMLPFGLGLLVFVFALLAVGLRAVWEERS